MSQAKVSISLSLSSDTPIYRQILDRLSTLIVAGQLREGDELPSIRALAQDLRVSVITVKRSYDELEALGLSRSVPGRGCFVSVRNKEIFREQKLRIVQQKLDEAVRDATQIGMSLEELVAMLTILYGDRNDGSGTRS